MGSVGLKKYGPSDLLAVGLNCHYDKELRASETIEHANKDINRDLTHLNYDLSLDEHGHVERDAMTWTQAKAKLQREVDEIDEEIPPKRLREDRRTWFMLEIHCPKELEKARKEDEFFADAFKTLNASMDGNLIWGQVHKDEVHEYRNYLGKDASGKPLSETRESMMHMDVIGIPSDPERGINMKHFMNKERIKKMQDSVHEMVLEKYGIDIWTYAGHSDITVDQLKEQSEALAKTAELQAEVDRLEKARALSEALAGNIELYEKVQKAISYLDWSMENHPDQVREFEELYETIYDSQYEVEEPDPNA